jgi:hypothetical protein
MAALFNGNGMMGKTAVPWPRSSRRKVAVDPHTTLTNLRADQSGIIGVIRRLHNLGCTLLELRISDTICNY